MAPQETEEFLYSKWRQSPQSGQEFLPAAHLIEDVYSEYTKY